MAKTEKLILELVVKNQQALGRLNDNVNNLSRSSLSLGKVVRAAVAGFAALGAVRIGRFIINTASQFEDLRVALSSVTGSIENGRKSFNFILDFAKSSIFEVQDLTNTFIKLKGAGIEPTTELLTLFQDVASVTTDRIGTLQAITDLFARTTAGGLGLEDLNRLADRGIPVFDMLSKTLGISRLEISKVGQTTEGAKLILDALSFSLERSFGGSAARLTTNYSQAVSNLNDALSSTADTIGRGFLPTLTELVKEASGGVDDFKELGRTIGIQVGAALKTTADILLVLAKNFKIIASLALARIFLKFGAAAIRAAGGIAVINVALSKLKTSIIPGGTLFKGLQKLLGPLAKLLGLGAAIGAGYFAVDKILKQFEKNAVKLESTLEADAEQLEKINQAVKEMDKNLRDADGSLNKFVVRLRALGNVVFQVALVEKFDELDKKINLTTGAINLAEQAFFTFTRGIGDAVAGAIVDAKNLQQALSDLAKTIVRELISGIVSLGVQILILDQIRPVIEKIRDAIFKQKQAQDQLNSSLRTEIGLRAILALFGLGGFSEGGAIGYRGARAMGGNVGTGGAYLVGERGPELFVPNTAGTVVSNEASGRAIGGEVIVNFNISATDATSFDSMLVQRRGLITNIINDALNRQGRRI